MSKKEIKSIIAELTVDILNASNEQEKNYLSMLLSYWYDELKNYSEKNFISDYAVI